MVGMSVHVYVRTCTVRVSPEGAEQIEGVGSPAIVHRVCTRAKKGGCARMKGRVRQRTGPLEKSRGTAGAVTGTEQGNGRASPMLMLKM